MQRAAVCSQYSWVTSFFDDKILDAFFLNDSGFQRCVAEVSRVNAVIYIVIYFTLQYYLSFLLTSSPNSWSYTYFQTSSGAHMNTIHTVSFFDEIKQQSLFALCFPNQIQAVRFVRTLMLM